MTDTHDFGNGPVPAHRHNGGGWVAETAWVGRDVIVGGEATVYDRAKVWNSAEIHDNARVYGNAQIFEQAVIKGNARVFDSARVRGHARIGNDARVYGHSRVWDVCQIKDFAIICGSAVIEEDAVVCDNALVSDGRVGYREVLWGQSTNVRGADDHYKRRIRRMQRPLYSPREILILEVVFLACLFLA